MPIRCHTVRPRRWLILLVLLAALPLPSAAARPSQQMPDFSGCRSVRGDDWFVEEVSFEPPSIAPGVLVEPTPHGARLSNTTDTPLYLVETGAASELSDYAPAAPISLTEPLLVRLKVVSGDVAGWGLDRDRGRYVWRSFDPPERSIFVDLRDPRSWLPGYRPIERYGDDRPANVALPSSTYRMRVIYGSRRVAIQVTVSARINPDYDPNRERNGWEQCSKGGPNFFALVALCIGVPVGILLALSLYVVFRIDRRYG
jgi:hypothetical protein